MKSFYILFILCCSLSLSAQKNKHSQWNQMLQQFVHEQGQVDYKSWLTEKKQLDAYIQTLEKMPSLEMASKEAKLAYWINAYNALTVQLILENYPLKSIRDLDDPWDTDCFKIKGKSYTLGDIEHKILRKMDEARIHFAINCASASCPKLRNEAYQPLKTNSAKTKSNSPVFFCGLAMTLDLRQNVWSLFPATVEWISTNQKLTTSPMTGALTKPIELTIIVPVLNEVNLLAEFMSHIRQQWSKPQELLF